MSHADNMYKNSYDGEREAELGHIDGLCVDYGYAKRYAELADAVEALAHPDGVIRGPLVDGPELDELNAALVKAREPK